MRLSKFLKIMGFVTVLAVTYIHMQMQIVDMAYLGNQKEGRIKKLIEENGSATYKILMLKSANHIGETMLEQDSDMQFADIDDIVQIATSEDFFQSPTIKPPSQLAQRASSLLNLLSLGVEAEARPLQ